MIDTQAGGSLQASVSIDPAVPIFTKRLAETAQGPVLAYPHRAIRDAQAPTRIFQGDSFNVEHSQKLAILGSQLQQGAPHTHLSLAIDQFQQGIPISGLLSP